MLNATFYTFSKRENSTLLPTDSLPHYSMQININDNDTSILNPQIRVRFPANVNLLPYNYVYIPELFRYYYITDWSYGADGLWTASCAVDALASWKTYIYSSGGYVGRSEEFYDGGIQDISYPSKNEPVTIRNNALTGFSAVPGFGTIVVGIVTSQPGVNVGVMGGTRYYLLDSADFLSFVQHLLGFWTDNTSQGTLDTVNWVITSGQQTYQSDWFKSLYTPAEYIINCRYYPMQFNIASNASKTALCLGGWTCGGNGGYLMNRMYEEFPFNTTSGQYYWGEIDVSNVSAVGYNNDDYPTYAPYAEYALQTPWGTYQLDPNIMSIVLKRQTPKIYWKLMLNLATGKGTLVVTDTNSYQLVDATPITTKHEFFRQEVQIGVDIPLMAQYQNELKVLGSLFGAAGSASMTIGSIATGNPIGAMLGLANTALGVADTVSSTQRYADGSKVYDGNVTPIVTQITVQQTRYPTVERAPQLFGRPLKRYVEHLNNYTVPGQSTPQAFSGFVQMDYSNFKGPCTETERQTIRNYLEGGVHLE